MILKPRPFRKPNLGHPLAKGLKSLWIMNEGGGNVIQDLSGNGNTGILVADTCWVPGKFGPALALDGNGDYVETTRRVSAIAYDADYSVVFWVKFLNDITSVGNTLLSQVRNTDDRFAVYVASSSTPEIEYGHYNGVSYNAVQTDPAVGVSLNTWYQVVVVNDGSNQANKKIYLNTVDTTESGVAQSPGTTPTNFLIGKGAFYTDGLFDHVMIYNRALSVGEIQQLYRNSFCIFEREPIELWTGAMGGEIPSGNAGIMTTWGGYWGATY